MGVSQGLLVPSVSLQLTLTPKSGPDAQTEVPFTCPSKPINRKCPRLS